MSDYEKFDEEFREIAKRHGIKAAWIEFRQVGETKHGDAKMITKVGGWNPSVNILGRMIEEIAGPGKFRLLNKQGGGN